MDVEPQECEQNSTNNKTKCRQNIQSTNICNRSVCNKLKQQKSTSKSVKPVCDIHAIGRRNKYKNKNWNIEVPKSHVAQKWEMNVIVAKFHKKPVRPERCEYNQQNHFHTSRKSFGTTDSTNIEIIINCTNKSHTHQRKNRKIGFLAIPEIIFNRKTDRIRQNRSRMLCDDRK